jgi:hypothetical protein
MPYAPSPRSSNNSGNSSCHSWDKQVAAIVHHFSRLESVAALLRYTAGMCLTLLLPACLCVLIFAAEQ